MSSTAPPPVYKFRGMPIPITITWKDAMYTFKDMGLNLLKIFKDQEVMFSIFADDELMINFWWFYIKDHASTMEEAMEDLTPEDMEIFKNKFWQAVVNFSTPLMRKSLIAMEKELRKELSSPNMNLRSTSLESSEGQE